jgi:hypothetical protein
MGSMSHDIALAIDRTGSDPFLPLTISVLRDQGDGDLLREPRLFHDSYLVDSASSHMLVSKIKPCMSKYKQSIR